MKKQFLNLGKTLNKAEQKQIFGGDDTGISDLGGQGGSCTIACGDGTLIHGGPDCDVDIRDICAQDGNNGSNFEFCTC